jgi:sirohydrochlorin ferrochelatase
MEAILILAHGSREKQTEVDFQTLVDAVRSRTDKLVETAFMEFSPKSIASSLADLSSRGIRQVRVIPYFLFTGVHIRKDIPEEIAAFREENPGMEIVLEPVLGTDPRMVDLLAERING